MLPIGPSGAVRSKPHRFFSCRGISFVLSLHFLISRIFIFPKAVRFDGGLSAAVQANYNRLFLYGLFSFYLTKVILFFFPFNSKPSPSDLPIMACATGEFTPTAKYFCSSTITSPAGIEMK